MTKCINVTIYDPVPNYGNRLQNYAVQYILKSMGAEVQTIFFETAAISKKTLLKYWVQKLFFYHLPGNKFYWKCQILKVIKFNRFNKKYIRTIKISSIEEAQRMEADYFVLGSDQVWNPEWYSNCKLKKDMYLLTFTTSEKKVTFSPSFSVDNIPEEWVSWFQTNLQSFPEISVREDAGADLIRRLTGQRATVLIDPTLMLGQSEWLKIAQAPKKIDTNIPYVLTYFIGGISEKARRELINYTEKEKMETYSLLDKNQPDVYTVDPSEFIYLISKAELIMTDSFHACVFSFLFQKPFLVYAREGNVSSMMSRMETFLKKFDLERKYVDSGLENNPFECEYSVGFARLSIERQKALSFLKKSIGMQE